MGMVVITSMKSLPEYCFQCPCYNAERGDCVTITKMAGNSTMKWEKWQ